MTVPFRYQSATDEHILFTQLNVMMVYRMLNGTRIVHICELDAFPADCYRLLQKHDPDCNTDLCVWLAVCKGLYQQFRQHLRQLIIKGTLPDPSHSVCTCGRLMSTRRNGLTFCVSCDSLQFPGLVHAS